MKELFKTTKQFKGKVLIAELQRAHAIIVLLALSTMVLLCITAQFTEINGWIVASTNVLLGLLALISTSIMLALGRKK